MTTIQTEADMAASLDPKHAKQLVSKLQSELVNDGVKPDSLTLKRWSLRFYAGSQPLEALERAFQARQAKRFAWPVRIVTAVFFFANFALVYYDWSRFVAGHGIVAAVNGVRCAGDSLGSLVSNGQVGPLSTGNATDASGSTADACGDARAFGAALVIRLGVMLPLCLAIIAYTYTPWYSRSAQPLAIGIYFLGNCLIGYSVVGRNPGYGVLALLILYIFSFTPVNVFISAVVCSVLIATFGVALGLTKDAWASTVTADASDVGISADVQMLNILGVLICFMLIVGFIGHNLEYWLRQSFLDEVRLQVETLRLQEERELSRALLTAMLPEPIIAQLQMGRHMIADTLTEVTVLFAELQFDISSHPPATVVAVLNLVYSAFDALIDLHHMHKIETVGQVYLCAGGCPEPSSDHAVCAADMALAMLQALPLVRQAVQRETGVPGESVDIKVGLNSGPCAAGVVGIKNPRYKLVGDTVNTASRMESTCTPGRVQVSEACRAALERSAPGRYMLSPRGSIEVKGKGSMFTYWLEGRAHEGALSDFNHNPSYGVIAVTPARHQQVSDLTNTYTEADGSSREPRLSSISGVDGRIAPSEGTSYTSSRGSEDSSSSAGVAVAPARSRASTAEPHSGADISGGVDAEAEDVSSVAGQGSVTSESQSGQAADTASLPVPPRSPLARSRTSYSGRALTAAGLVAEQLSSAAGMAAHSRAEGVSSSVTGVVTSPSSYAALELAHAAGRVTVRKKRKGRLPHSESFATVGDEDRFAGDMTASYPPSSKSISATIASPPRSGLPPSGLHSRGMVASFRFPGHSSFLTSRQLAGSSNALPSIAEVEPASPASSLPGAASVTAASSTVIQSPSEVTATFMSSPHGQPVTASRIAAEASKIQSVATRPVTSRHMTVSPPPNSGPLPRVNTIGASVHTLRERDRADTLGTLNAEEELLEYEDDDEQALAGFFDAVNQEKTAVAHIAVAPARAPIIPRHSLGHGLLGGGDRSKTYAAGVAGAPHTVTGTRSSGDDTPETSFSHIAEVLTDVMHETAVALGTTASSAVKDPSSAAAAVADGRRPSTGTLVLDIDGGELVKAGSVRRPSASVPHPDRTFSFMRSGHLSPRSPELQQRVVSLRARPASAALGGSRAINPALSMAPSVRSPPTMMSAIGRRSVTLDDAAAAAFHQSMRALAEERLPSSSELPSRVASLYAGSNSRSARVAAEESTGSFSSPSGKVATLEERCAGAGGTSSAGSGSSASTDSAAVHPSSIDSAPTVTGDGKPHHPDVAPDDLPRAGDHSAIVIASPPRPGSSGKRSTTSSFQQPAPSATAQAAQAHAKEEQEIAQARRQDLLALCLNISSLHGPAAKWERLYQHTMRDSWVSFLRASVVVGIVAIVLFAAQDYVKYSPYDGRTDAQNEMEHAIWRYLSLIRYALILPTLLLFLALTYTSHYRHNWALTQASTTLAVFIVGSGIIAMSITGRDPGYGVLALYLVYCLNFSILALALRIFVLVALVAGYICCALLVGNTGTVTIGEAGLFLMYLAVFTIGESVPVVMREAAVRQNFFRRRRIEIETRKLNLEEQRTNKLLANLLPPVIVPRLRGADRSLIADSFDEVTILWTDMKGFTSFSSTRTPMEVVTFLNAMFSTFDRILEKYGIQKVEVLGDAFFVVGGCPVPSDDHAERCVNAALEMLAHMPILRQFAGADISMRVGVHTGPVMAGVVGSKDPRYHLFGGTVPVANSMESHGEPGKVHISWETYNRLQANQESRARKFVDAVREMFGSDGAAEEAAFLVNPVKLETHTPSSHSVSAYPRIPFARIDAMLKDRGATDGPTDVIGSEVDADFGAVNTDASIDSAARHAGASSKPVGLSERVVTLTSADQLVEETAEDGVTVLPEDGEGSVRGQVQLWRRGAFLGWDIQTNLVQNDFIYSRTDLPLMLAMAPPATLVSSGSVTSQPPTSGRGRSPSTGGAIQMSEDAFQGVDEDGEEASAPTAPPQSELLSSTPAGAIVRMLSSAASFIGGGSGLQSDRGISRPAAKAVLPLTTSSLSSSSSSEPAPPDASAYSGVATPGEPPSSGPTPASADAARRAFREKRGAAAVGTTASGGEAGMMMSTRMLFNRAAAGGAMMSQRVLQRTMSTIEKAAAGLAGKLDYARSEILRAVMRRVKNKGADDAAAPGERRPVGPYKPDDPYLFFGPGAGFFAFEERPKDGSGYYDKPTYFVSRADPPLLPELAQAIRRLDDYIASAVGQHGTHPHQTPAATTASAMSPAAVFRAGTQPSILNQ